MKIAHKKDVTVTLVLNEMEASALAQLCVQVGGPSSLRRDFYHDVWRGIREALGEIPGTSGIFKCTTRGIDVTGHEEPMAGQSESEAANVPESPDGSP